jgi:hypothetical protein
MTRARATTIAMSLAGAVLGVLSCRSDDVAGPVSPRRSPGRTRGRHRI